MRYLWHILLCSILATSFANAQDTDAPVADKEPIQKLRTRKLDPDKQRSRPQWEDWLSTPRLRVLTYTGDASFSPRFWYAIQDRTIALTTRTWAGDVRGDRYLFSGHYTKVSGRNDISSFATEAHITPWRLGPIRPGLGYRTTASNNSQELFLSSDMAIKATTTRTAQMGIVDLGIGGYDRSYLRVNAMYGETNVQDDLNQLINGDIKGSIFAIHLGNASEYTGLGFSGAIRSHGFSIEGSTTQYRPWRRFASEALPQPCVITSGMISYISPLKVGVFARKSQISLMPATARSSLEFLNDGWTFGLTAQVP